MRVNKEAKMSNFSFNLESNDYKNSNIRESQKLLGQGTPSYVTPITKQKCKKKHMQARNNSVETWIVNLSHEYHFEESTL